jgi:hypothetical protein
LVARNAPVLASNHKTEQMLRYKKKNLLDEGVVVVVEGAMVVVVTRSNAINNPII